MSETVKLRLARVADADAIGRMSRDLIEAGLDWNWRPARVAAQIRRRDTLVLVACHEARLAGFAIMRFAEETAHLNLLAVRRCYQRTGIGRRLLRWLEKSAWTAGIASIHLEVRAKICRQGGSTAVRAMRISPWRPVTIVAASRLYACSEFCARAKPWRSIFAGSLDDAKPHLYYVGE